MHQVIRNSALDSLEQHRDARIVTICAPTGSGKSTLLAQWRHRLLGRRERCVVLDLPDTGDVRALSLAFLAALGQVDGAREAKALAFSSDSEALTGRLFHALRTARTGACFILDDFHRLGSPATVRLLTRLAYLETQARFQILIASRVSPDIPVSGLRLTGQVCELGPDQLRFTSDEALELAGLSGLGLDPTAWREFAHKVDGWAVALKLALTSLREERVAITDLLDFSGTQRDLAQYLSEQILRGLPQADRTLLLQCAAFDRLRPDLLVAGLGVEAAERCTRLIADLALPMNLASGQARSIQLHSVLRRFLIAEAEAAGVNLVALKMAAAQHLQGRGEWRKAMAYALEAGNLDYAAGVAERGGGWRLIYRGDEGTAEQFRQLSLLPRDRYGAYPKTALGLAVAAAKRGEIDHALDSNAHIKRMADCDPGSIRAEIRLIDALMDLYRDQTIPPEAVAQLENDLLDIQDVDDVRLALTQNLLCFCKLQNEEFPAAIRYGRRSVASFQAAASEFGAAHLPLHIGQAEFFAGHLENARNTLDHHLTHCETMLGRDADLTIMTRTLLREVDLEQGLLPTDQAMLEREFASLGSRDSWFDPLASLVLTRVRLARLSGEADHLDRILSAADDVAFARNYTRLSEFVLQLRTDTLIRERQFSEARTLLLLLGERRGAGGAGAANLRGIGLDTLSARLALAEGDIEGSLARLQASRGAHQGNAPRDIGLTLLRLRALLAKGEQDQAGAVLDRLALLHPLDRYVMTVCEEGPEIAAFIAAHAGSSDPSSLVARRLSQLLANAQSLLPERGPGPVHTVLTETETEIVALLSTGFSNKQIARELGCSANTVKFHLSNIYRKLDVSSRTAAVTVARKSNLIA